MKGKGKGIQDKDCPLQFPDLQPVDHSKQCPKYTSVISRTADESVGIEELDTIQTDLETLLASAGKRLRLLESEIQILIDWQEKKDKKVVVEKTPEPSTPVKRGKGSETVKPNKKLKDSSGKVSQTPIGTPNRPKSKNTPQAKSQELDIPSDSPVELTKLPKNDAVNRFWSTVEPYCADISNEDIKLLEDLLRSYEDDMDFFNVPPLGRLYSEKWAEEDLLEEQRDGAKISDKRRGGGKDSFNNTEATCLLKKVETNNMEESPFGPLTQRLISALIEENIMTSSDDCMMDNNSCCKDILEDVSSLSPKALAKQLNIGNPAHLEKRIKRELEEQGILEIEDKVEDNPDDEILAELRSKQADLKVLSQQNILFTKKLYRLSREEMARQDIRKKLATADAEVMDAYRKIQAARQKKKAPTKKERELALKAIRERDTLIKTLET